MIKFLKLTLAVEIDTATNADGKGVWRATCKSLNLSADGQSPDDALRILKEAILNAERVAANDLRVAVFNSKKNEAEIVEEKVDVKREEEKKEEEEEVVSSPLDTSTAGGRGDSAGEGGSSRRLDLLGKSELRAICEEQGLYTQGMTKPEMLKALNGQKGRTE